MKKTIKSVFIVILAIFCALPIHAFASDEEIPQWEDANLSVEQIEEILALNPQTQNSTRASDLIYAYNIAINRDSGKLYLVAKVTCATSVVKCGFKEIVIQRRASSTGSWSDYLTYEDLYADTSAYTVTKSILCSNTYQYRATCVYYAKKNILVTQRLDGVSNIA